MYNINKWLSRITAPRKELSGFSVCPYARGAEYTLIESDGSNIDPPPWDFELIIYKLPDSYTIEELTEIAQLYGKLYPDMVFLPDHRDRYTEINGVQTNNGEHNLILCQWRDNLNNAREKLLNTNYYSHWGDEYLKEILGS